MNRFFIPPEALQGDQVVFTGPDLHHLARVLRLRPGDRVLALPGDGQELEVLLETVGSEQAVGRVQDRRVNRAEPGVDVILVQGLPKGDKMDLILQKCTELGVTRFWPVRTERAVVQLDAARAAQRQGRWQAIAREAAEQCRRGRVPLVAPVASLGDALAEAGQAVATRPPGEVLALFPWEEAQGVGLAAALEGQQPRLVWLFIGPEGGFSPAEAALAEQAGVRPISLGPRILRTETAGIAAATMVLFALGELGRA